MFILYFTFSVALYNGAASLNSLMIDERQDILTLIDSVNDEFVNQFLSLNSCPKKLLKIGLSASISTCECEKIMVQLTLQNIVVDFNNTNN